MLFIFTFLTNRLAIFVYLVSGWLSIDAQIAPHFETLTQVDGLPFRHITTITQDSLGFMWFGSQQGIYRYDGYSFKEYNSDSQNPFFIPKDQVTHLDFENGNRLWYVANNQLFHLDIISNQVKHYAEMNTVKGSVHYLHIAQDGIVWIASEKTRNETNEKDSLYLQRKVSESTFETVAQVEKGIRPFTAITTDKHGTAWWATCHGIFAYTQNDSHLQPLKLDTYDWFGNEMSFIESYFDPTNRHYFFPKSIGGISNYAEGSIERLLEVPHNMYYVAKGQNGNTWFAGKQTLYEMTPNGAFRDLTKELHHQLEFSEIASLFVDRENVLWIATDNGIIKLSMQEVMFHHAFHINGQDWGNTMRTVMEGPDGKIIAMCESQEKLLVLDPTNGITSELTLHGNFSSSDHPLREAHFFSLSENGEYAYTGGNSWARIRLSDGYTWIYDGLNDLLDHASANANLQLSNGQVILGATLGQLTLFDPVTESLSSIFSTISEMGEVKVTYFEESKIEPGTVWVGTTKHGLVKVDLAGKILAHYHTETTPQLSNDHILVLHEEQGGSLWIGTFGGGLNRLNPEKNEIQVFRKSQGLPDDNIVGLVEDDQGNLWISTYNGLSTFDKQKSTFQNFYIEDGLTHNEFNYSSFLKDSKGRLYFGGMNGLNYFEPEQVLRKKTLPPLTFTNLTRYNSQQNTIDVVDWSYRTTDQLIVSPHDQYFTLSWTVNSFFNNDENHYSTFLKGSDQDWVFQGSDASIRYNRLPPGVYILHVRATDARGNSSTKELALPIRVQPFFYQTWWFIGACVLVIAVGLYALFRYRLKQALATERLKTRISSDIHDEVGSVLSGLIMQVELLEMNARKEDLAKLQKIKSIGKSAITQMRDLVWGIDPRRQKIGDLTNRMQEVADELLTPRSIQFIMKVDEQLIKKELSTQVKQNIFLIYKEAINNVVKHSNADRVDVVLCQNRKGFSFSINDNGFVDKKTESSGLGLDNMKMRAGQIRGHLNIYEKDGFTVNLSIPSLR